MVLLTVVHVKCGILVMTTLKFAVVTMVANSSTIASKKKCLMTLVVHGCRNPVLQIANPTYLSWRKIVPVDVTKILFGNLG